MAYRIGDVMKSNNTDNVIHRVTWDPFKCLNFVTILFSPFPVIVKANRKCNYDNS